MKFTYRTPKKISIFSGQEKWVFKERLLLPTLSKSIQIGFEVRNTYTGEEVEFKAFIVIGNDSKEVDSTTKEFSYDLPPDREINFYFKCIEEKPYDFKSFLLIKSITFNKSS